MLNSHYQPAMNSEEAYLPLLVFVHGFLGAADDWQPLHPYLKNLNQLYIELPGHGASKAIRSTSFASTCRLIHTTILDCINIHSLRVDTPICFVGYSLGARLLMYFLTEYTSTQSGLACLNSQGLVIEGGNFGLQRQKDRELRLESDRRWAKRFNSEPIVDVLGDWYRQPVFSSLNHEQRQLLIAKRSVNLGSALSDMLMATSLGHQPYLLPEVNALRFSEGNQPLYISGEYDTKFTKLAQSSGLHHKVVEGAGHNVHKEQPEAYASALFTYLEQTGGSTR
ncbi:2-succinyl-6-hydroxy-2,4-cyclohexadiene-1-carboxylate synthase [Vibrio hangzhouensis]|nr:2-succinyl-6-hydroxy-2,4-cyclohexadiene-1-carboxylate synthase [Vibrio hangzhouensis]